MTTTTMIMMIMMMMMMMMMMMVITIMMMMRICYEHSQRKILYAFFKVLSLSQEIHDFNTCSALITLQ